MPESGSLNYEVARIEQAALSIAVPDTVTYGDAPFSLVTSGGSGAGSLSYAVTEGDAVSVNASTGVVTVLKAGSATVTVTKAEDIHYNAKSASIHITVNKAAPPTVNYPSASALTYGQPLSESALTGGAGDGTFAWESPGTIPTVQNTGYTVIFTPNDTDNYDYTGVPLSQTVSITVHKATPAVTFPTAGEITYGQRLAESALTGGSGDGSFTWESPDTIPAVVNSGYIVVFTPNDTDNYNTVTQVVAITVLKAEQAPLAIAEPSVTYGDAPFGLSVSGGSGTGSLRYAVTAGDAVAIDDSTGLVTVLKAGLATVTVTKAADSNYNQTSTSVAITVVKALPAAVFPVAAPITYGQPLSASVLSGGSGDGAFAWKSPDAIPTVINSGFSVVFTPSDTDNYVAIEQTMELIVNKAAQTPLTVSGIPENLTFGDKPFRLTVNGGSGTGALSYAVVSGQAAAVDAAGKVKIEHAGTSAIKVTNSGDDNYLPVSQTVMITIKKAAQSAALMFELPKSITYGDEPFQIFGSGGSGNGSFSYSVASGDAVKVSETGMVTVLRPGIATIAATKAGDIDYISQTAQLRLSVKKGVQNKLTISGIPDRVDTSHAPFQLIVTGGSGTGALSYKVVSGNAIQVDAHGEVTILKKGTALLSVTKAEDDYYLAATATARIDVKKAEPSPTATATPRPTATVAPSSTAAPTPTATAAPSSTATAAPTPTVTAAPSLTATATPSSTATAEPSSTATAAPSPTATAAARSSATDASSSPTDSPTSMMLKPLSIHNDGKAGNVVITILINDLPESSKAIRLPSGKVIPIDTTLNSLELPISPRDINEAGELVIIALNKEHAPMGSYLINLSDDAWQNGASNGKAGFGSMLWGIAAGVFVIAGAMAALLILSGKKK